MVTSLATSAMIPAPTAKSLGAARARNGVSIGETMTDFRALFAAAEQSLDVDALQSLAEGWAEVTETGPPISCTDVYTGLATPAHFQRRIHEVSAFWPERPDAHALAVISLPRPSDGRGHGWTLLVLLGEAVRVQLRGTGAIAMYQNSAVQILFPLSENNLPRLVECKAVIESLSNGALSPASMRFYPLSAAVAATAIPSVAASRDSS